MMKGKYFNWSRFPLRFLKAVLSSEATPIYARPDKFLDDADFLCPYMDDVSEWPNSHFVRRYRREIEDYFLPEENHLIDIARRLEKKNYGDITAGCSRRVKFAKLRRSKNANSGRLKFANLSQSKRANHKISTAQIGCSGYG